MAVLHYSARWFLSEKSHQKKQTKKTTSFVSVKSNSALFAMLVQLIWAGMKAINWTMVWTKQPEKELLIKGVLDQQSNPGAVSLCSETKQINHRISWQQICDFIMISKVEILINPSAAHEYLCKTYDNHVNTYCIHVRGYFLWLIG